MKNGRLGRPFLFEIPTVMAGPVPAIPIQMAFLLPT
jgi:hypothetical protein